MLMQTFVTSPNVNANDHRYERSGIKMYRKTSECLLAHIGLVV